jgi:uncharacterized protein (TIGR00369 family)
MLALAKKISSCGPAVKRFPLAKGAAKLAGMTDDSIVKMARQFIEALPHAHALGMTLEAIGDGRATVSMPYDARLIGDPATGVIHGGAVSALMDTASGASVMCHPAGPRSTATLDLRIDYMRAAIPGQAIRARAHCHHVTRSVAFVTVTATDDDDSRPVAIGTGAFTVDGTR